MGDFLFKIFGVAILAAFAAVFLRKSSPDIATLLKICGGVVLASACIVRISPVLEYVNEICSAVSFGEEISQSVGVLLRVLCVAILTGICSNICRDCGEMTIAQYTELGGKIEMLILALPLFESMLATVVELVGSV
jgi:stage III sporulation protein AD